MEMAKSKVASGCGRARMSATATACGGCWAAMAARLVDLFGCEWLIILVLSRFGIYPASEWRTVSRSCRLVIWRDWHKSKAPTNMHSPIPTDRRRAPLPCQSFPFLLSKKSENRRRKRDWRSTKTYRSDATINTFRFTAKYFPFPQPTSNPTEPGSRFCKKRSIMGQGFSKGKKKKEISYLVLYCLCFVFLV